MINIIRLATIGIYSVIFAMSFGFMELNALLVASLFVLHIFVFTGFINTLTAKQWENFGKDRNWLYYLTNMIDGVLILFMLFGQIEFWYMVVMYYAITIIISFVLQAKVKRKSNKIKIGMK